MLMRIPALNKLRRTTCTHKRQKRHPQMHRDISKALGTWFEGLIMPRHLFVCIGAWFPVAFALPLPLPLAAAAATLVFVRGISSIIAAVMAMVVAVLGAVWRMPVASWSPSVGISAAGLISKRTVRIATGGQASVRVVVQRRVGIGIGIGR